LAAVALSPARHPAEAADPVQISCQTRVDPWLNVMSQDIGNTDVSGHR